MAKEKFVPKNMKGSLFKNLKKTKETHPDYRGDANIEGKVWSVSAWVGETVNGDNYLSLNFQEPYEGGAVKEERRPGSDDKAIAAVGVRGIEDLEDDIPF